MNRYLPLVAAVALVVAAAVWQGFLSERWQPLPELRRFGEALTTVPIKIGTWEGKDSEQPGAETMQLAGGYSCLSRVYSQPDGEAASVFLICGHLHDMLNHTPNMCYPAHGFQPGGEPKRQTITTADGGSAEFYTSTFFKPSADGNQHLRIYWSWCATGPWVASEEPLQGFARNKPLYKLYVIAPITRTADGEEVDAAHELIRVLAPTLEKSFTPAFHPEEAEKQVASR